MTHVLVIQCEHGWDYVVIALPIGATKLQEVIFDLQGTARAMTADEYQGLNFDRDCECGR